MIFSYHDPVKRVCDLEIGKEMRTAGRTVEQSDIITFCGLVGDPHPLHLSKIDAEKSPAGRIVAPAPMIQGMAIGLMAQTHWLTPILVIFSGIKDMRALKPVYPGDTIYVDVSPANVRESKSGKGFILDLLFQVYARRSDNLSQEDVLVMTFTTVFLVND